MIQILHNPRCSKSRNCLAFIEASGAPFKIIRYLNDTPTFNELQTILAKLQMKPIDIVRTNEPLWIDVYANRLMTDDDVITALTENPVLIQRPIVVSGENAIIARDSADFSKIL